MPFLPSLPKGASLLDLYKAFPEMSIPLIQFHEALLRRPSPFTEGERELIAAYVSGLNCRYCHGVYSATAELLGISANWWIAGSISMGLTSIRRCGRCCATLASSRSNRAV